MRGLIEIRTNMDEYYFSLLYKLLSITIFIFLFHFLSNHLEINNPFNNGLLGKKLFNEDLMGLVIVIWLTILFHDFILNKLIVLKNN